MSKRALLRFDGGCRPTNPGHAAFGAVVYIDGETKHLSRYIGWRTVNESEYFGLIVGVKFAHFLGAEELEIFSDSQIVVNQVKGKYRVTVDRLKPLRREARDQLDDLFGDDWTLKWQKRDYNTVADKLCTRAINYGRNLNPILPQSIKNKRPGEEVDPFAPSGGRVPARFGQSSSQALTRMLSEIT